MSAERLRELAWDTSWRNHERCADDGGVGVREGHEGPHRECPHPDCVLVRSDLEDTIEVQRRKILSDEIHELSRSLRFARNDYLDTKDGETAARFDRFADEALELSKLALADLGDTGRATPEAPESLAHAAKLLALSLTDEMCESLRTEWGNTNVHVLKHWKQAVLAAVRAPSGEGRGSDLQAEVTRLQRARIGDSETIGRLMCDIDRAEGAAMTPPTDQPNCRP